MAWAQAGTAAFGSKGKNWGAAVSVGWSHDLGKLVLSGQRWRSPTPTGSETPIATPVLATSADGISWSTVTTPWDGMTVSGCANAGQVVNSIVWGHTAGRFVAIGNYFEAGCTRAHNGDTVLVSPDGTTWTSVTVPVTGGWHGSCDWSETQAHFLTDALAGGFWDSPDGMTWTQITDVGRSSRDFLGGGNNVHGVVWADTLGLWVDISNSTRPVDTSLSHTTLIMTSPDRVHWTPQVTPLDPTVAGVEVKCYSVGWSHDLGMLVVGTNYGLMTSTNATTWITRSTAWDPYVEEFDAIVWSPSLALWCLIGSNSGDNYRIMTSPDGLTWTRRATPWDGNGGLNDLCWADTLGLFVATGWNFTSTPSDALRSRHTVITSPDGITWTERTTPFDSDQTYP